MRIRFFPAKRPVYAFFEDASFERMYSVTPRVASFSRTPEKSRSISFFPYSISRIGSAGVGIAVGSGISGSSSGSSGASVTTGVGVSWASVTKPDVPLLLKEGAIKSREAVMRPKDSVVPENEILEV